MKTLKVLFAVLLAVSVLAGCSLAPDTVGVTEDSVQRTVTTYTETFANCTKTGTSYVSGSFVGVGGWTWNYVSAAWSGGDINGKTPVLGKGKSPAASVYTTVNNGVGTISFKVKKPYSTAVNVTLKMNGTTIATITHSSTTAATKGPYTINRTGSVKIEIVQTSTSAGQASIDDITWTSYDGGTSSSSSSSSVSSSSSSVSSSSSSVAAGWVRETSTVASPNYPSAYGNNANVTSTFSKTGATKVRVHFSAFNTENNYDKVYLKTSSGSTVATYTGNKGAFLSAEVTGSSALVNFTSDSSVTAAGWKIDYVEYYVTSSSSSSSSSSVSSSSSSVSSSSSSSATPGSFQEDFSLSQSIRDYYRSAYGLSGSALKTKLQQIITAGYVTKSYSYLYTIYADADRTSDSKVWDIYSDRDGTGLNRPYTYSFGTGTCGTYSKEGDCYNREHMIPQSKFNEASPMVSDAHHVLPTDGKVNGMRSSYPHGAVASATWTSQNGSKLGSGTSASGYTGTVFEPINAYKGDTARIYFYFCVRYYNNSAIEAWESMNAGAKLKTWAQTLYRQWASADPVSAKEVARNNGVYTHQKNRNPFVDYPVLCNMIDFAN
ncbi:MAG TPA: endonuclease [Spirochaetota bacterium]|nr:endonuclease [Spirochaetota bacterium]